MRQRYMKASQTDAVQASAAEGAQNDFEASDTKALLGFTSMYVQLCDFALVAL